MCRIVGFWDLKFKDQYDLEKTTTEMRDTLSHGGPDDCGLYVEKETGFALGHRRLSILDLSPAGRQPMEFDGLVIVYNGEVYNFGEIRKELEKEGYEFFSNTDTEVILKAFHRWGTECVHRFRGMFAFAIWNRHKKELVLCRDRIGVKPLYWYYKDGLFMFASELKAFHKHPEFSKELNFQALSLYLQYAYIPAPFSIFKNTHKVKQGHFLIVKLEGNSFGIREIPYWDPVDIYRKGVERRKELERMSEDDMARELEEILTESFKLRLVSDVPVGVFLSGGIDSSTVTAILQKESTSPVKTFTIGFYEKDYNEAEWAKKVAKHLGTDHHELYCTPREAFEIIPKLPEIYDEPFGDSSAIPTYLVSRFAREHVKVALSADGGDEQFYGYTRYWRTENLVKRFNEIPKPLFGLISFLVRSVSADTAFRIYQTVNFILPKYTNFRDKWLKLSNLLEQKTPHRQYDTSLRYFLEEDIFTMGIKTEGISLMDVFSENTIKDFKDFMMLFDMKTYLPDDILVKVDRASMSVALEAREPFLDRDILEYTILIPSSLKYKNGVSKYILRKILYKYVPKEFLERPKQGFSVPIYEWFKSELKDLYLTYLSYERIKREGIFNPSYVDEMLKRYFDDKGVNHTKLWLIFIFEVWLENF